MPNNEKTGASLKDNRSVRKTKTALRKGLLELMKSRSILHISVTEICDIADVGRSTFYKHYESHYDLLEQIETECISNFEENMSMNQPLRKYNVREITLIFEKTLAFIAEEDNYIQILLSENGKISFQRKFIHRLIEYFKDAKKHYTDNEVNIEISECYAVFVINGAIALIHHWLKNNKHISIPELARILTSLTIEIRQ